MIIHLLVNHCGYYSHLHGHFQVFFMEFVCFVCLVNHARKVECEKGVSKDIQDSRFKIPGGAGIPNSRFKIQDSPLRGIPDSRFKITRFAGFKIQNSKFRKTRGQPASYNYAVPRRSEVRGQRSGHQRAERQNPGNSELQKSEPQIIGDIRAERAELIGS
jgi:hypothetical protein